MFQIRRGEVWVGYAGSIGGAREIVRCEPAGHYNVEEVRAEVLPIGIRTRQWGQLIRMPDGRVEDQQVQSP
jgi:hypothetical protein